LAALVSASTTPPTWWGAEERASHLSEELALERPDLGVIRDLLESLALNPSRTIDELGRAIPHMSRAAIELAWNSDLAGFKVMIREYGRHVEVSSFGFDFCDIIANFFERSVVVTRDPDVLSSAIRALVALGYAHNRWHVQGVATRLLQDIRDAPTALTASEALRDCRPAAVEWTISDFACRSLHPALRRALDSICNEAKREG